MGSMKKYGFGSSVAATSDEYLKIRKLNFVNSSESPKMASARSMHAEKTVVKWIFEQITKCILMSNLLLSGIVALHLICLILGFPSPLSTSSVRRAASKAHPAGTVATGLEFVEVQGGGLSCEQSDIMGKWTNGIAICTYIGRGRM